MIDLRTGVGTAEDRYAQKLNDLIAQHDPDATRSGEINVCIAASVQCYGQRTQDIDIVVLMFDRRARLLRSRDGVSIQSCCVAIELKQHSPDAIRFEGPQCIVRYRDKEHNVSSQSEGQKYSLRNYIDGQVSGQAPYINNLVWLCNVPQSQLPRQESNLIGSDVCWQDILDRIARLSGATAKTITNIRTPKLYFETVSLLTKRLELGTLDRKRMEAVAKRVTGVDAQYIKKLGEQLLIFRGRGGTGKTVRLLQIARQLYEERGERVVILTYNNALVADIRRLLTLLRIDDGIGEAGIGVRTVHRLVRDWLLALGLIEPHAPEFLEEYAELKKEFLAYLKAGALDTAEIAKAATNHSKDLFWDFVCVDECQDWPADERDILYRVYDHKRFILADGIDQFVRNQTPIDWRETVSTSESQVVPLTRSLRIKAGLCDAVSFVADQLQVPGWYLQPEPDIYGGRLFVFVSEAFRRDQYELVAKRTLEEGNSLVDSLICIPPDMVQSDTNNRRFSTISRDLEAWGYRTWDGAAYDVRSSFPTSKDQQRIIQYDSCRGLEGWSVICLGVDTFFDWKLGRHRANGYESPLEFQHSADTFAARWLMIPLTRAIDTLAIHLRNPSHPLATVFKNASRQCPGLVTWME